MNTSVIIPTKQYNPDIPKINLPRNIKPLVVTDFQRNGAPWARNLGYNYLKEKGWLQKYVFFCDDDIVLQNGALNILEKTLEENPNKAYAYGYYQRGREIVGYHEWSEADLRQHNFVTTMSLIRSDVCPKWDESIKRLQDWDLWLTMLEQGHEGIFVEQLIFTTPAHDGITYNGQLTYQEAHKIIKEKHGI